MKTNGLERNNFTTERQAEKKANDALKKSEGTNPKAQLDKDAFMKLLLTELRYQDPTRPMDTEKMLTQTSQLAALETQENTNQMMKKLADQMKSNTNMYALGVLGKMARVSDSTIEKADGMGSRFAAHFESPAKKGVVTIKDANGKVVREFEFEKAKAGVNNFGWDGKDAAGNEVKSGVYKVEIKYTDEAGKERTTGVGTYKVEGVSFIDGVAHVKIAGQYVSIDKVKEFTEPAKG